MLTPRLEQVIDYNARRLGDYAKACEAWKSDPSKGGFPSVAMYTFNTPEGSYRLKGWVVSTERSAWYYPNIRQAKLAMLTLES